MSALKPVRVEINEADYWNGSALHLNANVIRELEKAGIPIDGAFEIRTVLHGKLTISNDIRNGSKVWVYNWAPGKDSPRAAAPATPTEDEEL